MLTFTVLLAAQPQKALLTFPFSSVYTDHYMNGVPGLGHSEIQAFPNPSLKYAP